MASYESDYLGTVVALAEYFPATSADCVLDEVTISSNINSIIRCYLFTVLFLL